MGRSAKAALSIAAALALAATVAGFGLGASPLSWFAAKESQRTLLVSGNIEAHESVLSFQIVQSRIVELPFDEGQSVKAGTVIARLDDADYRQQAAIDQAALEVQQRQLASAEQTLDASRKTVVSDAADVQQKTLDYNRAQTLWKVGTTSTQLRDQARTSLTQSTAILARDQALARAAERNVELGCANVRSAEETLKMARIVLGYTVLRAPFDGVMLVRQAELGEVMMPGTPVFTIADLDHVWLRAYINETDIGKVRYGATATITTDTYPGKKYTGRISFISSEAEFTPKSVETHAERVTLVYRIRIDIDNPTHELVPGMPADAQIELKPAGVS
jgi:HlyD family secretion protein